MNKKTDKKTDKKVKIKCFGGFEVYKDGIPVRFSRSKSKELLALLVDRKGVGVTNMQIADALYEEREYTRSLHSSVQKAISTLKKDLDNEGILYILNLGRNNLSILTDKVYCDYFEYINGDDEMLRGYAGDYMRCYSWAEVTNGYIDMKIYNRS